MIKYVNTEVVFEEIPDEITLAVNISNCQNNCPGCHSAYLKQNIGEELTETAVDGLIDKNRGITCFCFMGEGNDAESLKKLILYINEKYPDIKVGLYSGRNDVEDDLWDNLDYLKLGPYVEELGPLNKETTNQRLYRRTDGRMPDFVLVGGKWQAPWVDITYRFWRKKI